MLPFHFITDIFPYKQHLKHLFHTFIFNINRYFLIHINIIITNKERVAGLFFNLIKNPTQSH